MLRLHLRNRQHHARGREAEYRPTGFGRAVARARTGVRRKAGHAQFRRHGTDGRRCPFPRRSAQDPRAFGRAQTPSARDRGSAAFGGARGHARQLDRIFDRPFAGARARRDSVAASFDRRGAEQSNRRAAPIRPPGRRGRIRGARGGRSHDRADLERVALFDRGDRLAPRQIEADRLGGVARHRPDHAGRRRRRAAHSEGYDARARHAAAHRLSRHVDAGDDRHRAGRPRLRGAAGGCRRARDGRRQADRAPDHTARYQTHAIIGAGRRNAGRARVRQTLRADRRDAAPNWRRKFAF